MPISRLAEAILEAQKDLIESGLTAGIAGHVGDGNFYVGYCIDPKNTEEVAAANGHNERMARALEMDGTCSVEHGIGQGKIRDMETEHGLALNAMQAIKQALDPLNIMNPARSSPPERLIVSYRPCSLTRTLCADDRRLCYHILVSSLPGNDRWRLGPPPAAPYSGEWLSHLSQTSRHWFQGTVPSSVKPFYIFMSAFYTKFEAEETVQNLVV